MDPSEFLFISRLSYCHAICNNSEGFIDYEGFCSQTGFCEISFYGIFGSLYYYWPPGLDGVYPTWLCQRQAISLMFCPVQPSVIPSLSGVPDYFDRNKILSGYDLSIIKCLPCIRVFFYFVWFVFIHHNFQFYFKSCIYCNILDIYLS